MSKDRKYIVGLVLAVLVLVLLYYFSRIHSHSLNYSNVFNSLCVKEITTNHVGTQESTLSRSYLVKVLVLSRPSAILRRNAIRNTWKKPFSGSQSSVLIVFSIGISGLSDSTLNDLTKEQDKFGDLVLLDSVIESYSNLTNKVLRSFVVADLKYKFSYLIKCDDDTYLALDVIVEELRRRTSRKSYYWGKMFEGSHMQTTGKFAEKKWFLASTYIPYALGAAYILSGDLVKKIAQNSQSLMQYHNEDVSVSVWISPFDVERQHDRRVCEIKPFTYYKCSQFAVVLHPVSAEEMVLLQEAYKRNTFKC